MRSQLYFVLRKILSDYGILDAVTADSLSHMNHTDRIWMIPAWNNAPIKVIPTTSRPSSNQYEVISDWIPSSESPPQRRIVSYFVARTHP
jgi:hypothetical protein